MPIDGRMTSFELMPDPFSGDELFWVVQPGNVAQGVLYKVTIASIGAFAAAWPFLNTAVITSGATSGSPYPVGITATAVLFNKTVGSASYAVLPNASSMLYHQMVLFKDIKGDAFANNINISFSDGQSCDGQTTLTIDNAFGWLRVTPLPDGSGWYQS